MDKKVAIITGSSSGIGGGIALYFAEHGYKNLVLVARRYARHHENKLTSTVMNNAPLYFRAEKLKETSDKCKSLGAKEVLCLSKDLHDLKANKEIVDETVKKFGSERDEGFAGLICDLT